ncbi:hypothetical protein GYMLUDRAFT_250060 [Collybiopsis luxurians FD-317 M1]|uniref:Mid2 domain-containing protein n=1 Tax=Collybiopsis luxurians FD-317 M1 TaxID=944289 RepID=A0A0D0CG03_9AGAR|nr:hypothetical protein GYMLUDRAFT_250060 [Collybiopsis luxurians FD-317 M1]
MHLFAWLLSLLGSAGSLSISFPPSGTPTAFFDSQNVTWQRDKTDPAVQFFLQKIKLDEPEGPTVKSTPIPTDNSQGDQGTSPMVFSYLKSSQSTFNILKNGEPFFTTEVTVVPNPTLTGSPLPPTGTSASSSKKTGVNMNINSMKSATAAFLSSVSTKPTSSDTSVASASTSNAGDHTALLVGAVMGGVGLFLLIGNILLCLRRRRRMTGIQLISTTTRHSEESAHGFISPFALGRPISPSEEKHRPRSIQREGTLPGLQSEENNIPSAPSAGRPLPSRIQRIRSALNISMNGAMEPLDNNVSLGNPQPNPAHNEGQSRHQDSGSRILSSFRSRDSGETELPPDYSSV